MWLSEYQFVKNIAIVTSAQVSLLVVQICFSFFLPYLSLPNHCI